MDLDKISEEFANYYTSTGAMIFGIILITVFTVAFITCLIFLFTYDEYKDYRSKQTTKRFIGLYFVLPAVLIADLAGGIYLCMTNYSKCSATAGKETSIVCTTGGKKYHVAFDEKTNKLSFTGEPGTKSMTITISKEK